MEKVVLVSGKLLLLALLVNLMSCAPAYVPNVVNAPVFKGKHEVNLAAYGGTNGVDGQVSGSITDHLAVMADYSHANHRTGLDSSGFRQHDFFEGGVGFYEAPSDKKMCYEVWGGYGSGNSMAKAAQSGLYNAKGDVVSGNYYRIFGQADFGFRIKYVETGFALRYSYVNFSSFTNETENITWHGLDNTYLEPFGFVRGGASFIKAALQVGASVRVSGLLADPKFTNAPFFCTLGIYVTLNRKW